MIFASTPSTGSARHKGLGVYLAAGVGYGRSHSANPALLDFRTLHGTKRGAEFHAAAVAWHSSLASMVMAGAYGYYEGAHARRVLVRLAALSAPQPSGLESS
jgi:hypothetical protein